MMFSNRFHSIIFLFLTMVIFLFMAGCATTQEEQRSQKETDAAFQKNLEEALQKAKKKMLTEMEKPEYWEKIYTIAVRMPAVKENPVLWQHLVINSFFHSVKDMRFIAEDRLLINYRLQPSVLMDTTSGEVLWKYDLENWKMEYPDIVTAFTDLILLRDNQAENTFLAAVDGKTGKQLWLWKFKSEKRAFQFLPVPGAGVLLAAQMEKEKVTLTAKKLFTGNEVWEHTFKVGKGGHPPPPAITAGEAWHFYGKTAKLDAASGKISWERNDLVLDNRSPPPVLHGGILYLIDARKTLNVLKADTGESTMTVPLSGTIRYTNIYPAGKRIYLRGETEKGTAVMTSLDGKSGKTLWSYASAEPTVSNLIEDGGQVYAATSSHILCLNAGNGKEIYRSPASQTGQTFPVRLRKFGNTLVYVGELVIAGFNARTGKQLYFKGMTPLSQETHLDALDNWVSVLQKRIGTLSKAMWFGGSGGAADAFSRQAEISQNLSNHYADRATFYRGQANYAYNISASSDYWKSARLQNQAQIESAYSGAMSQLGFFFAMENMKNAMLAKSVAADRKELTRLQRIRTTINRAYGAAEAREYAYRPHVEGQWVGVNLIHLPTGKTTFSRMTPLITDKGKVKYNNRALWNLIDFEKGIIYHHGLRILPAKYQDKNPSPDVKAYGIYLVAEKIKLPK
jgi:outer membrane protein assembly factor BamB